MARVAAELVGANSGLGFLINDARSMLRTDIITVGMLTIGIVGLVIDAGIRALTRRTLPWSLAMAKQLAVVQVAVSAVSKPTGQPCRIASLSPPAKPRPLLPANPF